MKKIDTIEIKRRTLRQIKAQLKFRFVLNNCVTLKENLSLCPYKKDLPNKVYEWLCYGDCSDCYGVMQC